MSVCVICSWFATWHWAFELATHFYFQYFVGSALLLPILLILRKWKIAALATLLLLLTGFPVLAVYRPVATPEASRAGPLVSVLSCNVLTSNRSHFAVLDTLQKTDADIIVLLEVSRDWLSALGPLRTSHPHFLEVPSDDNFGMAVYSRLAGAFTNELVGDAKIPLVSLELSGDCTGTSVLAAHPLPPISSSYAKERNVYLNRLSERASELPSTIIVGDLNITPYAPNFRKLIKTGRLRDSRQGWGLQASWPSKLGVLGIPIDHGLVSPNIRVQHRQTIHVESSDHRAVLLECSLPQVSAEAN